MDVKHFETLDAAGEDIHAAVVIPFRDLEDFGGATDVGDAFFRGADNAKRLLQFQTLGDHFFVSGLEDVQGQGNAGEENEVERE